MALETLLRANAPSGTVAHSCRWHQVILYHQPIWTAFGFKWWKVARRSEDRWMLALRQEELHCNGNKECVHDAGDLLQHLQSSGDFKRPNERTWRGISSWRLKFFYDSAPFEWRQCSLIASICWPLVRRCVERLTGKSYIDTRWAACYRGWDSCCRSVRVEEQCRRVWWDSDAARSCVCVRACVPPEEAEIETAEDSIDLFRSSTGAANCRPTFYRRCAQHATSSRSSSLAIKTADTRQRTCRKGVLQYLYVLMDGWWNRFSFLKTCLVFFFSLSVHLVNAKRASSVFRLALLVLLEIFKPSRM